MQYTGYIENFFERYLICIFIMDDIIYTDNAYRLMDVCGIDEAGRGPVIGPMVMAILCGNEETIKNLGVRDSKKLSPSRRLYLYGELIKYKYKFYIISPAEIDKYVREKKLNILEEKYAMMLINHAENDVYIDCFDTDEKRLENKLIFETKKKITCKHHADNLFPIVSGASIIAKVIRDKEISKLHEIYGDFGSGYPSDIRTINFLKNSIKTKMDINGIVRTEWKTYKNLKTQNYKFI